MALMFFYGISVFEFSKAHKWHVDNLYVATFGFFVFVSPFMFAYYTYIKTIDNKYISVVRNSALFEDAQKYMMRAIYWSFLCIILSAPLMVIVPEPDARGVEFYVVVLWVGSIAYAMALVARSAYHFSCVLEVGSPSRFDR